MYTILVITAESDWIHFSHVMNAIGKEYKLVPIIIDTMKPYEVLDSIKHTEHDLIIGVRIMVDLMSYLSESAKKSIICFYDNNTQARGLRGQQGFFIMYGVIRINGLLQKIRQMIQKQYSIEN